MHRRMQQQVTLCLDADILGWFGRHAKDGRGWHTDINKALRASMVAQDRRQPSRPACTLPRRRGAATCRLHSEAS